MKNIIFITLSLVSILGIGQSIEQIGYFSSSNANMGICSKDNYMILSNGDIIDNTDLTNPILISHFSFDGFGNQVLIDGDYAYFGTEMSNDLFIADISNISSPLNLSTIDFIIGHGVFGMDISENTLFMALGSDDSNNGILCSIDVSNKNNPIVLDTLYMPGGQCRDIVVQNNYAYAAHYDGLKIIDITNPSDLQLVTSIGSQYNSIDIGDNRVYLGKAFEETKIDVYDISEPTEPILDFSIPTTGGSVWDLKYHENLIYIATNASGLFIYKIEDNVGIEMANFSNTTYSTSFGLCLQDSLVYLAFFSGVAAILQYDPTGIATSNLRQTIDDLNIFPNPAKNSVLIKNYNKKFTQIKILDSTGKFIKQIDLNSAIEEIDISDLSVGEYLFMFETKENTIIKKVIKIE